MRTRVNYTLACAVIFVSVATGAAQKPLASLEAALEPIRAAHNLPGLAAAVVRGGQTVALGAVGVRKAGSEEPVTRRDKWHIGSCTKSMTAALAAMLIEDGRLRWDTTLAEMFPKLALQMQTEWRGVTLAQLLAHHGGAPQNLDDDGLWGRLWDRAERLPRQQRAYLTRRLLTKHKPVAAPGAKYVYSNAGYALVGHAIEEELDCPWETVLRRRLFQPLGMDSGGFGTPATPDTVDQPWGHKDGDDGALAAIAPGLRGDNPAAIGPGGTVHCSIGDLAQYAAWQLRGACGKSSLLQAGTFTRLHTPFAAGGDYACGWAVVNRSWGGGTVLTHGGSNTMFFAVMWLAPKKNFAVVVCTNLGGKGAETGVDRAAAALIREHLSEM
jgi:CubicO group peptidase (beta-lactamase class C family)